VFNPHFTITNRMTAAITRVERARGFLEAAEIVGRCASVGFGTTT